eukprot:CAMPEP_0172790604 /NCGR_PEP_ID=MMETSP1074-20121228/208049_1 /TAXON_ID=2916 /ORGANISM="Ceratium fusus, Strain PA161109" /LENGTH=622 /DNA_ID=CAMNT_0013627655 /DNA_START=57 /DNA_END=1924 /DNA_ORIENTATION=-
MVLYFFWRSAAAAAFLVASGLAKDTVHNGSAAAQKEKTTSKPLCQQKVVAPKPGLHATDRNGWRMPTTCYHEMREHHVFVIGDWGGRQSTYGSAPFPADRTVFPSHARYFVGDVDNRAQQRVALEMQNEQDGLVIGDWGGRQSTYGSAPFPADRTVFPSHARHFVGDVDNRAQQRVALEMQKRAGWAHPEYILNVGDNFYWGGVNSHCGAPTFQPAYKADCDDQYNYCAQPGDQWKKIFLDVYGFLATELQWLGVLGNHDYGGFMFTKGWDHAISRSYEKSANGMWMTPAQYWSVTMDYDNFTVDYFFMDTNHNDAHDPQMDQGGAPTFQPTYKADCDDQYNYCAQPGDQWKKIFLDVYGFLATELQWLGVLGNHDYGGFMFTKGWDHAISRSYEKSANGMWMTPAQYWSVTMDYENFTVDYFFMDTNHNDAHDPQMDQGHNLCSAIHNKPGASCGAAGPSSVWDCPNWFQRLWGAQKVWVEGELQKSVADWQIIVTHFPPDWETSYWQYLCAKYGVDLFLAGHRHMQELHHWEIENAIKPTPWVVTGGGGGVTSEHEPNLAGTDDQYGFTDLTLTKNQIKVQLITHTGRTLKETVAFKRLASKWRQWNGKGPGPYDEGCKA